MPIQEEHSGHADKKSVSQIHERTWNNRKMNVKNEALEWNRGLEFLECIASKFHLSFFFYNFYFSIKCTIRSYAIMSTLASMVSRSVETIKKKIKTKK